MNPCPVLRFAITQDPTRDNLLTEFGKQTLVDRYLLPGESFQGLFARVACAYADTQAHAQRLYDYMSKLWFMPSTPVLSNGGAARGLPISCHLNEMEDSMQGIAEIWNDNVWLASKGGGIGTYVGNVRSVGERVGLVGETSGVMPFLKVMDSQTLAISQGSLRRGSAAVYMPIDHPEIEEFIEMRRPTGGDPNRKCLNLFNGVVIPDAFMEAVKEDKMWELKSPHTHEVISTVSARGLWIRLLTARLETGAPYITFIDTVNSMIPEHHKQLGINVKTSNLCLTGDTRIATSKGLKTLKELFDSQENFEVVSDTRTLLGSRTQTRPGVIPRELRYPTFGAQKFKSTPVFKTGENQKVFLITTSMGRTLRGTADHEIMTPTGMVKISDLEVDSEICVQSGEGIWSEQNSVFIDSSSIRVVRQPEGFNPPTEWSQELGEVLGWMVGDGYIAKGSGNPSLVFGDKEEHLLPYFQNILEKWFPNRISISRSSNIPHLIMTSKPAGQFFQMLGVKMVNSPEKVVPEAIFTAPRSAVVGFLRGLFSSDGTVVRCKDAGQIGLGSTSEELLRGVQVLLSNFGINSTVYFRKPAGTMMMPSSDRSIYKEYNTHAAWELRIGKINRNKFMKEIGFMHAYKTDNAEDFISGQTKRGAYQDRFTDRVVSVSYDGKEDVYDITVDTSHSFIANGVVVHNCNEITLPTGKDHLGNSRSAVCCLSSLNLDTYDEWKDNPLIVEDVLRFLDNVLQDFINRAPDTMSKSIYSATRERSVGLGVMGFHSFLQKMNVPFESAIAKSWNLKMFKNIKAKADAANSLLATEKGACPDAEEAGIHKRFSNMMAIAPTASISIICGGASPGIEPSVANVFGHKTLGGTFTVRNVHLKALLAKHGRDDTETWTDIMVNKGSVQHLDFLSEHEKDVFKTAIELDQRWVIDHAADRTPFICQGQSLNIFLPADVSKKELNEIHLRAWKAGVKGLYYCRSLSIQRAETVSQKIAAKVQPTEINGENECLACQ